MAKKMIASMDQFLASITSTNKGAKFVALATKTIKLPGKGMTKKSRADSTPNPYSEGVERRAVGRFILGVDYESNVNAQREREGQTADFKAEPLWGGKGIPDNVFPKFVVVHTGTGKRYLKARPHTTKNGHIVKEHDGWYNVKTGKPIVGEELAQLKDNFLDKPSGAPKQGVAKEIPYRVFEFSSVVAAKCGDWTILV